MNPVMKCVSGNGKRKLLTKEGSSFLGDLRCKAYSIYEISSQALPVIYETL